MEMQDSILVLPEELVIEILLKLPIKSLLKFKCISKSWLALISSSEFVKTHLRLNANNKEYTHHKVMMRCISNYGFKSCSLTSLFNESCVTEAKDLDYPTKSYGWERDRYDVSILGSINGLICLVNDDKELFLWNPSIRKHKKLPDPRTSLPPQGGPRRAYGFGYDEVHDDYKVVIFNEIETNMIREFEVKMYSLKSDSWRCVDDCPRMAQFNVSGKFVNGKLHWDSTSTYWKSDLATFCDGYRDPNIISIDLADEKWGEMDQPCDDVGEIALRVGVLGSDLSVLCNCNMLLVDVWVMKEYGVKESWTKMFTIKYTPRSGYLGQRCLHMSNEGEILVVIKGEFMIYNPKDDSLRYSEVINSDKWDANEIYVESLVCP
uniref:F-Box protein n=1 Tax=Solanum tuberosum TaxID=4113 RepID=M1D3F7_SOLTU